MPQTQPKPKINPDIFHSHLDHCTQCRDHPTDLCPIGKVALSDAVGEPMSLEAAMGPPRIFDMEHGAEEAAVMRKVTDQVFGKGFSNLLGL